MTGDIARLFTPIPWRDFTCELCDRGNALPLVEREAHVVERGMSRQQNFPFTPTPRLVHGGELTQGKRKTERPLKTNRPIHVVLRAKRAGLKTKQRKIQSLIKKYAERFNIKVYRTSINSNHIHLLIVTPRRLAFQNFLRSVTGLIARLMGVGKLWEHLAFSRVANWAREYRVLTGYILKNQREAMGVISYVPRSG